MGALWYTVKRKEAKKKCGPIVDAWIWDKWLKKWRENPIGAYQHIFIPTKKFILSNRSRKKDITVNRLRLVQTKLNAGLYKLGLHQTDLCEMCNVEESC